jgi:endonuclease I
MVQVSEREISSIQLFRVRPWCMSLSALSSLATEVSPAVKTATMSPQMAPVMTMVIMTEVMEMVTVAEVVATEKEPKPNMAMEAMGYTVVEMVEMVPPVGMMEEVVPSMVLEREHEGTTRQRWRRGEHHHCHHDHGDQPATAWHHISSSSRPLYA